MDVWQVFLITFAMNSSSESFPRAVILNLFYISYPFIKQDYQIYPQYTQWCSFIKNTKLTNSYSLEWFIKIYICCNLWFSKFISLEDEITPGVDLPQVKNHCLRAIEQGWHCG